MKQDLILDCEAKDKITGFQGIVYYRAEWLNGCVRLGIQPQKLHEGKPIEGQTFDIEQIEYVGPGLVFKQKATGGERPNPVRAKDPIR